MAVKKREEGKGFQLRDMEHMNPCVDREVEMSGEEAVVDEHPLWMGLRCVGTLGIKNTSSTIRDALGGGQVQKGQGSTHRDTLFSF